MNKLSLCMVFGGLGVFLQIFWGTISVLTGLTYGLNPDNYTTTQLILITGAIDLLIITGVILLLILIEQTIQRNTQ